MTSGSYNLTFIAFTVLILTTLVLFVICTIKISSVWSSKHFMLMEMKNNSYSNNLTGSYILSVNPILGKDIYLPSACGGGGTCAWC